MSLIRPILRLCAVAALRDRTWAENRIYDSDNTPLIDALSAETKPYITVYTDDDNRIEIEGKDIYATVRRTSLILDMGVASAVEIANGGKQISIPQTDQAMELFIDLLEGQALAAIISDPHSEWGEIIRRLVNRIERIPSVRGGSGDKGTRWAARQVTIICQTISDPAPGTVLRQGHPVRDFIALAKDPAQSGIGLAVAAELIEKVINETADVEWRQVQAWLGLTEQAIRSTGIAPALDTDETEPKLDEGIPVWDEQLQFVLPEPLSY